MSLCLSRDVIKWLQHLDLGANIKNPKRDFANGYLIALIFSRYYPNEIQIQTLYTGDSMKVKQNNWVSMINVVCFEEMSSVLN
jgi:hypothetical protein